MVRKSSLAISLRGSQLVNEHGQGHEYLIEAFLFLSFPSGVTDLLLIVRMQSLRMSNSGTYFVIKAKDLSPILASGSISIHSNALFRWQANEMLDFWFLRMRKIEGFLRRGSSESWPTMILEACWIVFTADYSSTIRIKADSLPYFSFDFPTFTTVMHNKAKSGYTNLFGGKVKRRARLDLRERTDACCALHFLFLFFYQKRTDCCCRV